MKWTQVESGSVYAAGHQFLTALGDEADIVIARANSDPAFVKRVARFAICGGFEATTSQERGREIMGKNFFGVEEAIKHFGVKPTRQQLVVLSEIPFSEAVLEQSKNTHVLVAVFPLSILDIYSKVYSKLFYDQWQYNKQPFVIEHGEGVPFGSWQLVCKAPVENSFLKSWQEQEMLIGKDDKVPTAQVMIYTIIGHFLATGERMFENIYVRTSSVASGGVRVYVGYFVSVGLSVRNDYWDDSRYDDLGVSSARKF